MWVTLQNNADWDCSKTLILHKKLEDSKSTSGGTLCIFGSHTFVPISWMCKKQTSVSHSSTESEIIYLDARLRKDVIPALDLWDLIVTVLHGNTKQSKLVRGNLSTSLTRKSIPGKFDLNNVDFVPSNANSSHQEALLYIFVWRQRSSDEDDHKGEKSYNETCFQNPQSCSWLVIRSNQSGPQNPNQIHRHQKPTRRHWQRETSHVMRGTIFCVCFNISHFSSINSVKAMSKRTPEGAGEERVTAKSKPMMNLVSRCSVRNLNVLASNASESLGKTRYERQKPLSSWNEQQPRTGRCDGR